MKKTLFLSVLLTTLAFRTQLAMAQAPPAVITPADGRTTLAIFPQFAEGRFSDGTYYRSILLMSNPSTSISAACTLSLYGASGTGVSQAFTLGPNQWNSDQTDGQTVFLSGFATVGCNNPINTNLIYSYYAANGVKLGEATVFPSLSGSTVQLIADQREGSKLGIAIANDKAFAQTVTLRIGDSTGAVVATPTFTLAAHTSSARFLDELIGPGRPTVLLSQILISCSSGCAAIGLRYTGTVFTTIPSSVRIP